MDTLTKKQRHKNMQRIRSKDTSIELILRRMLWKNGFRYRKNYRKLQGSPDIVLTKYRIAIFCDSEFFHGKDWENLESRIKRGDNSQYWLAKIRRNMERDREVDQKLRAQDWTVLRFWGNDIKKSTEECLRAIQETVFEIVVDKRL